MDLIISPHLDDEVLGCSSFLGPDATVLYLTELHPLFPNGLNVSESHLLEQETGHTAIRCQYPTNRMSGIGEADLVALIEEIVSKTKPATALVPFPSYNQDHRITYECAMTALRVHDRNPFVKRVLVYEEPDVWGTMRKVEAFRPTYFRPIDIMVKLGLWSIYRSQQRGHRTEEDIRTIAHTRGMQSHLPWAEAFEVARWVD